MSHSCLLRSSRDSTTQRAPHPNEGDLVRLAQRGDRQAFARLVEEYWGRVYGRLYRLTRNRHIAEDVTQETFLKALRAIGSFRAGTCFPAWLFRIARNTLISQRRRRAIGQQALPDNVPAESEEPPAQAMHREALAQLTCVLGRLPNVLRAPYLLRTEQCLSFRDIAGILNVAEETARWRVCTARKKLIKHMAPHLGPN
jgi:RNA polymerase sigma-70 factor, ECF subfamily